MHPFDILSPDKYTKGCYFMTSGADHPHSYSSHSSRRKKRRHRTNDRLAVNVTAFLLLAALILGLVAACWKGVQYLMEGMEAMFGTAKPREPGIMFTEPEPTETEPDLEAPVLSGIHELTVYQGNTPSYMDGITATDNRDKAPFIAVDSSSVDLTCPGIYSVTYTATDSSGNTSRQTVTLTVLEMVELDVIYAAADAKLSQIIRKDSTVKQQVRDIYAWARLQLSYGGHSDRTDWRQTAYEMLTEGVGDCYGYWAVTKLLFERLEITNIDVQKVKNSDEDADHFWSMVSLDGGQTWYHFDATPRMGDGDDFCLVTDDFLDAYSDAHDGSHNRDKERYPLTP